MTEDSLDRNKTPADAQERLNRARIGSLVDAEYGYLVELSAQLARWKNDVDNVLAIRRGEQPLLPGKILSPRSTEVLRALDSDLTYEQVAAQLGMSVNTVRHHIRNIYHRLGVNSRHGAVLKYNELSKAKVSPEVLNEFKP